jgi:4-hydroxybenzoate polyprenyltransferase
MLDDVGAGIHAFAVINGFDTLRPFLV